MPYYDFGKGIDRTPILPESTFANPMEPDVRLRGAKVTELPGLPIVEMSRDQKEAMKKVLQSLLVPYRKPYQDEVMKCLEKQGGIDKCHLIFYQERTLGKEGTWDNWRIEGPAFVWYFRGYPRCTYLDSRGGRPRRPCDIPLRLTPAENQLLDRIPQSSAVCKVAAESAHYWVQESQSVGNTLPPTARATVTTTASS